MMTDQAVPKAIEAVLDIARWAPSGDNAQPWTFRIIGDREVEVLVRRANPNIYEYRHGEPTLISAGALLENMEIAAPAFGLKASWRYSGSAEGIDHIVVHFTDADAVSVSDLFDEIARRSVDRRPFKMRSLTAEQKSQLSEALHQEMQVQWYDSPSDRRRIAALSALATNIRLRIPETFAVHRGIVDWENRQSERGIPSRALGLDPLTLQLTRWSMANWSRTKFMNTLGAPYFASLQMDFLPGLFCASYFAIRLTRRFGEPNAALVQTIQAGQAIQRFWLTATKLGLVVQPCVAILAFWTYASARQEFTVFRQAQNWADKLAGDAEAVFGKNDDIVFLGRIGRPRAKSRSRSVRLPLSQLMGR
jgi:sulfur-carrier protein adenylyltransferase/sulfurtransferase